MRANHNWVTRMLTAAAILTCTIAPMYTIAAEPSLNQQLQWAAGWHGSVEKIKALLEKGGDANAKDKDGKTALSYASANNRFKIVSYLKAHGAK